MVFNKSINNFPAISKYLKLIFLVCLILVGHQLILHSPLFVCVDYNRNMSSSHIFALYRFESSNKTASRSRTLVVYIYGKTNLFSEKNLVFSPSDAKGPRRGLGGGRRRGQLPRNFFFAGAISRGL